MNEPQPDDILHELSALSAEDQDRVRDYITFLRWRATQRNQSSAQTLARTWQFNFLEQFTEADIRASHDAAGMEAKTGEASVGGERRPALWEHPPVRGEAVVEFHVPVPAGLRDLRLRFALGIRDGVQAKEERLVAYRLRVDGWQIWSRAAWPTHWEPVEIVLPMQSGDVMRLSFVTDGLGDHRWAWAVWGEPTLAGTEVTHSPGS